MRWRSGHASIAVLLVWVQAKQLNWWFQVEEKQVEILFKTWMKKYKLRTEKDLNILSPWLKPRTPSISELEGSHHFMEAILDPFGFVSVRHMVPISTPLKGSTASVKMRHLVLRWFLKLRGARFWVAGSRWGSGTGCNLPGVSPCPGSGMRAPAPTASERHLLEALKGMWGQPVSAGKMRWETYVLWRSAGSEISALLCSWTAYVQSN